MKFTIHAAGVKVLWIAASLVAAGTAVWPTKIGVDETTEIPPVNVHTDTVPPDSDITVGGSNSYPFSLSSGGRHSRTGATVVYAPTLRPSIGFTPVHDTSKNQAPKDFSFPGHSEPGHPVSYYAYIYGNGPSGGCVTNGQACNNYTVRFSDLSRMFWWANYNSEDPCQRGECITVDEMKKVVTTSAGPGEGPGQISAVPLPGGMPLFGTSLTGLALFGRRRIKLRAETSRHNKPAL